MPKLRDGNKKIFWIVCSVALLLVIVYLIAWCKSAKVPVPAGPEPVACTMEAKVCADGSAVGRGGPNCEFAACPKPLNNEGWLSTTSPDGVSFQYPESLGIDYVSVQTWPAELVIEDKPFECVESGDEIKPEGQTINKMIGNKSYCVTKQSEGAAGSVYTTYTYAFAWTEKMASLKFVLRSPQCANYDEPKKSACQAEQGALDIDDLADKMARSAKMN